MTDTGSEHALDAAARRVSRALDLLEERLRLRPGAGGDLFDQTMNADRQRLADELDEARARGRELESAAVDAVGAVAAAMAEVRAVLESVDHGAFGGEEDDDEDGVRSARAIRLQEEVPHGHG